MSTKQSHETTNRKPEEQEVKPGSRLKPGSRFNRLLASGLGFSLAASALMGCGEQLTAEPKDADRTPVATSTLNPTETTSASPTPSETLEHTAAEVPPYREWSIPEGALDELLASETPEAKWAILGEIIENNKYDTYDDIQFQLNEETVDRSGIVSFAAPTMSAMAIMADLAQDPNVEGGDVIATEWANLSIVDEETRNNFIERTTVVRELYATEDQATVDELLLLQQEAPAYHLQPTILHASDSIHGFIDLDTDREFHGATITSIYQVPDYYNEGFVTTLTLANNPDSEVYRLIVNEYPESDSSGWSIAYNPGQEPIKVSELPSVVAMTSSSNI